MKAAFSDAEKRLAVPGVVARADGQRQAARWAVDCTETAWKAKPPEFQQTQRSDVSRARPLRCARSHSVSPLLPPKVPEGAR